MGYSGWAAGLVGASGSAAFISAFKLTSIANVSLIYAASPLLASLLAWAWAGERLTRRVLLGCAAAFTGVAIIVSGSIGGVNLRGDLLAAWMTLALAIWMVIYRRYPKTPAAGPYGLVFTRASAIWLMLGMPFFNSLSEIADMISLRP